MTSICELCRGRCPECGGGVGDAAGSARLLLCSMCHATFVHDCRPAFAELSEPVRAPLDVVQWSIGQRASRLLVEAAQLPDDFFDLSTGFAGEFVQKMQSYGIRVAAVLPADRAYTDRFREFVIEARRGRQFRTFEDRAAAKEWLASSE